MDNREIITQEVLNIADSNNHIILELGTGVGKTLIALKVMQKWIPNQGKALVVVPRLVLIDNWKKEIEKWSIDTANISIDFITYMSYPKVTDEYDVVIYDEAHHFSERCCDYYHNYIQRHTLWLSATLNREVKERISSVVHTYNYKVGLKEAVDMDILPEPKVLFLLMRLNIQPDTDKIILNPKKGKPITVTWKDRWKFMTDKTRRVEITCSERQWYTWISDKIEYYKKLSNSNPFMRNRMLQLSLERLKHLSDLKTDFIKSLLKSPKFHSKRYIVFCNSIEQAKTLCKHNITSDNEKAHTYLEEFNNKKINHISGVGMLQEGLNLVECKIGIFANINASELLTKQKLGRLLRHKKPVVVIPFYIDTREAELVEKIAENFSPKNITRVNYEELQKLKL